jgi:hypothetical protein
MQSIGGLDRVLASPFVGAMRMIWLKFLMLGGLGSVPWAGAGIAIGVVFAEQIPELLADFRLDLVATADLVGRLRDIVPENCRSSRINLGWNASRIFAHPCQRVIQLLQCYRFQR